MSTNNDKANRVKRLENDIRELKTNQTLGGDSWVVYRKEIQYTKTAGSKHKITFTPDIAGDYVAVAMWFWPGNPDRRGTDQDLAPDPNINGVWWDNTYAFGSISRGIMIWSTKKGTVKIEQV